MGDLAHNIEKALCDYDDGCSYEEFADAVAEVLKQSYGKHLFERFKTRLTEKLKQE